jgi:hypothetical protein
VSRRRSWLAVSGVLVLSCFLVACGGEEGSATRTLADDVTTTTTPEEPPGCDRFCRQAGGFGAGEIEDLPVTIPAQEIPVREGIAEVRATCDLDVDCVGAIILSGSHIPEYGRADLEVPAGTEAVARVEITPEGLEALEREGDDPESVVTIPLVDESQPVSFSDFLTILAP